MSVKIASLYAEISADTSKLNKGLKDSKAELTGFAGNVKSGVGSLLAMAGGAAAAGLAVKKMFEFMKESVMEAARVEEMGVVVELLGERAGMTKDQIEKQTLAIKDMGITTEVAHDNGAVHQI